jgi:hypothetical protein
MSSPLSHSPRITQPAAPSLQRKEALKVRLSNLLKKTSWSQKRTQLLTSNITTACQLCLPSLQASSTDVDVYTMDEADAGATGADGKSAVPGLGPGPGPPSC